jgi:hypothetical protein
MSIITKKTDLQKKFNNSALPQNINDVMGNSDSGSNLNYADLSPEMPNKYINESGDSNQMGRSQEEEIENNTDIEINNKSKIESEDLDDLTDNLNQEIDKSIRVSGGSDDD